MKLLKTLVLLLFIALIASCGSRQIKEYNDWQTESQRQVDRGNIKQSQHYLRAYDKVSKIDSGNKTAKLELLNTMIDAAYALEEDRITQREFDSIKRHAGIIFDEKTAAVRQRQAQALSDFGKALQEMDRPRKRYQTNCTSWGNNIDCTTY